MLNGLLVALLAGPNEVGVTDLEFLEQLPEARAEVIAMLLWEFLREAGR